MTPRSNDTPYGPAVATPLRLRLRPAEDSVQIDVRRIRSVVTLADPHTRSIERLRYRLSRLHTSPQHAAVLDCLFNLYPRRTNPVYDDLIVIDDRLVFARAAGEKTFRHFCGRREQLTLNVLGFVDHLGLGTIEREFVLDRIAAIPARAGR